LTDVTTAGDGRTSTVFTAPSWPLPQPECSGLASDASVSIVATPVGSNFQTTTSVSTAIRMLAPSATTPAQSFAANFSMSPNPVARNVLVFFSDAGSVSPGHTITNFEWSFGDGSRNSIGPNASHDYGVAGTYVVTLTVTDDIGQSGSKSALLTVF
jgi:PKD repeat protein